MTPLSPSPSPPSPCQASMVLTRMTGAYRDILDGCLLPFFFFFFFFFSFF